MSKEPASDEQEKRPLWERQPWDTDASYTRFHEFFLSQSPPRNQLEAYRRYKRQAGASEEELKAISKLSGLWQRWVQGQDTIGTPIPGAVGWEARAAAYDEDRRREWRESWHEKERQIVEVAFQQGLQIALDQDIKASKKDAVALLALAAKLGRLNMGLPTERSAVTTGPDYSELDDEQINDAIKHQQSTLAPFEKGDLAGPSFGKESASEGAAEGGTSGD